VCDHDPFTVARAHRDRGHRWRIGEGGQRVEHPHLTLAQVVADDVGQRMRTEGGQQPGRAAERGNRDRRVGGRAASHQFDRVGLDLLPWLG
jgi:hypothetical protein